MNLSDELKVGIAIVAAALLLFIGFRFFQDIPIFKGTYELATAFDDANGLVAGNAVKIKGVRVGAVEDVSLRAGQAYVTFRVNEGISIPRGSTTSIGGIAALGSVSLDVTLGPSDTTRFEPGDVVPSAEASGVGDLLSRAPELVSKVDTLLVEASAAVGGARRLLDQPDSELRQTLTALQGSADALTHLLRTEQERLRSVLVGVDTVLGNLDQVTGDTLQQTVQHLNRVLNRLDRNLATLEATTSSLNVVVARIERGEGTLGLLVNDPGLYHRLDSTLLNLNRILLDFERNPKRYLKDLKLVDVF